MPDTISIENQTQRPFTCGLSQMSRGIALPIAAFPLYGKNLQSLTPAKKVFLMMATMRIEPGTALKRSYGPGILIDFTGATTRALSFEINTGWSWGGAAWAQQVPAYTDIVPLLIIPAPAPTPSH